MWGRKALVIALIALGCGRLGYDGLTATPTGVDALSLEAIDGTSVRAGDSVTILAAEVLRRIRRLGRQIAQHDRDHARQLRRSSLSVPLNIAEGSAASDGRQAIGYVGPLDTELRDKLGRIIATLINLVR